MGRQQEARAGVRRGPWGQEAFEHGCAMHPWRDLREVDVEKGVSGEVISKLTGFGWR